MITIIYLAPPPSLDRSRSASVLVLAADGSILRGFLTGDGKWRLPIEPAKVDPLYRRVLIAAEDGRFAWHPGVDPIAASRALAHLAFSGHIVSGASTLTMQAARLLEPHPRSLVAKLVEMTKALALERIKNACNGRTYDLDEDLYDDDTCEACTKAIDEAKNRLKEVLAEEGRRKLDPWEYSIPTPPCPLPRKESL